MRRLALAFTAATLAAHGADPLSLKGIAPGMTLDQVEAAHPGFTKFCGDSAKAGNGSCLVFISRTTRNPDVPSLATMGGAPVRSIDVKFIRGQVATVHVRMENVRFGSVLAGLNEKFGEPAKVENSSIQNRAGASFDQVEATWKGSSAELTLRKRAGSIDVMSMDLAGTEFAADLEAQKKDRAKASAKDL